MQLGYVIIYVPDVVKAIAFYETAFGLTRKFLHEGDYGELATGTTTLAFASEALRERNGVETLNNRATAKAAGVEIALVTDDIDAAYGRAVAAGAKAYKQPALKPWGQTVAYVHDLNGFLVELCTPVAG